MHINMLTRLADNLGTYQSVLFREFSDAKIVDVTAKTTAEKYRDAYQTGVSKLNPDNNTLLSMSPEVQLKELITRFKDNLNK